MTINTNLIRADIGLVNADRGAIKLPHLHIEQIEEKINLWLGELGITNAEVDFVRNREGYACFGSYRLPLLVKPEGKKKFVMRGYDHMHPEIEKRLLPVVSGNLAPKVYHLGKEFYTEELLDLINSARLEEILALDPDAATRLGAETHARLARLRINYNHNRWLNEFHLLPEGVKVTDFGTSVFFFNPGQSPDFDKSLAKMCQLGVNEFIKGYFPWLQNSANQYGETVRKLSELSKDQLSHLNLLQVVRGSFQGFEAHFARVNEQVAARISRTFFPHFVKEFCRQYKAI